MALSWNEIRSRAVAFSKEWENEVSEDAEAKSFWDAFFNVFGVSRRLIATFEQPVRKLDESMGYRPQPLPNETKRIEYLFDLYEKYTTGKG
jgi:hypothetical protein